MRLLFLVIGLVCLLGVVFSFLRVNKQQMVTLQPKRIVKVTPTRAAHPQTTHMLFVPYWTLSSQHIDQSMYDRLIYFGVTVNTQGINTQEDGYTDIDNFLAVTSSQRQRLLCVRMITTDINNKVLADKMLQQKIIQQSIALAQTKGFDGIVLDFEITALGFDKITNQITVFENSFADSVRSNHLLFFSTVYGDTFVRFRPFDVKAIAQHDDGIFIMAYDYHKAGGNPGPNFPFSDKQDGYSFPMMISDFLAVVPAQKLTVVFGLFGYDWTLDEQGNSTMTAASLSDNEIKQEFLDTCAFTDCRILSDPVTDETHITYTDTDGKSHVVWFENMDSVAKKQTVLSSKNIGAVGYWAYSYF